MAKITTTERNILISLSAESAGIPVREMRSLVRKANDLGLSTPTFVKNEGWTKTDEELSALVGKKKAGASKRKAAASDARDALIASAAEKAGMAIEEMKALVAKANDLGLSAKTFVKNEGWKMSQEELSSLVDRLREKNRARKLEKSLHVAADDLSSLVVKAANRLHIGKDDLSEILKDLIDDQEKNKIAITYPRFLTRALGAYRDAKKQKNDFVPLKTIKESEELNYLIAKFASVMEISQQKLLYVGNALMNGNINIKSPIAISKAVASAFKDAEVAVLDEIDDTPFNQGPCYRSAGAPGWTEEQYLARVAEVGKLGISQQRFDKIEGWDFTDDELLEFESLSKQMTQRWAATKDWCVNVVREKTGWDRDQTVAKMEEARRKGYPYSAFLSCALWKLSDEAFAVIPKRRPKPTSDTLITDEELEEIISDICKTMGWTRGQYRLDFMRKRVKFGTSPRDYSAMRLYEKTDEEIAKFATFDHMCKMRLRYCDYMGDRKYFTRKTQFDAAFEPFLKRRWFTNIDLTFDQFVENVKGLDVVFYKPSDGACGRGVCKLPVETDEQRRAAFEHVSTAPVGVIEQEFIQHPSISAIWNGCVNTLRIMTLVKDGEVHLLAGILRVGCEGVIDNIAHGGVGSSIDMETGVCSTYPVDQWGNCFEVHPITKAPMKGFQIPNWEKVVALVKEAAMVKPNMAYVGWDVTVTADGEPAIIEGNTDPAIWIIQIPWAVSENVGMEDIFGPLVYDFDFED